LAVLLKKLPAAAQRARLAKLLKLQTRRQNVI
jgi:hypothetical protein